MIHIDLGIPARKGIVDKIVGEEITFKKSFSMRGKARALPKVEKAADDLIKGFQEEKDKYIDSVKLDLLYKSSDPCECLGDLHRLLSGIASLVNEAKHGLTLVYDKELATKRYPSLPLRWTGAAQSVGVNSAF